jgi:hypothetical protein
MGIGREHDKGQVFIVAAVLFSSLAVLLFMTTADISQDQTQSTVKDFYENVFSGSSEKLNHALEENYSIKNARNSIYSYSRFIDRSSTSKGISFEASYFIVMPQKGKSVFINYRDSPEKFKLYNSDIGWENTSISANQYLERSFSAGKNNFRIIIPERDIDRQFTASSPRIFTLMKLSASNQIWINSEIS